MFCVQPPGWDHQVCGEERSHPWEQLAVLHRWVAEVLPHNSIRLRHERAVNERKHPRRTLPPTPPLPHHHCHHHHRTCETWHFCRGGDWACQLISVRACEWLPFIQRVVALVRACLCLCTSPVHIFFVFRTYGVCVMVSSFECVKTMEMEKKKKKHSCDKLEQCKQKNVVRRWEARTSFEKDTRWKPNISHFREVGSSFYPVKTDTVSLYIRSKLFGSVAMLVTTDKENLMLPIFGQREIDTHRRCIFLCYRCFF